MADKKQKHLRPLTRADIIMRNNGNIIRQETVDVGTTSKARCLDQENRRNSLPSPVSPLVKQRKRRGLTAKRKLFSEFDVHEFYPKATSTPKRVSL